jgi:replicative DNA helicase
VDVLTRRAERAVLGALIARPALRERLRFLADDEFADPWHQRVYRAVSLASHGRPPALDGWRDAISAADPSLAPGDLDGLVRDCPSPDHGVAYGVIVVSGWAQRQLAYSGMEMAVRSRRLGREARAVSHDDPAAGQQLAALADHTGQVARVIRAHAASVPPGQSEAGPVRRQPGASPGQARREELVLAALMRSWPQQAAEIIRIVQPEAFADPFRREVFRLLDAMLQAGHPVDQITLDWELAAHGIQPHAQHGQETYGQRLARNTTAGYQEAIMVAYELQDQHERASQPRTGRPGRQRTSRKP